MFVHIWQEVAGGYRYLKLYLKKQHGNLSNQCNKLIRVISLCTPPLLCWDFIYCIWYHKCTTGHCIKQHTSLIWNVHHLWVLCVALWERIKQGYLIYLFSTADCYFFWCITDIVYGSNTDRIASTERVRAVFLPYVQWMLVQVWNPHHFPSICK